MANTTRLCEICRQPIDADRLEAVPETRLCITHAREAQKYGGEFILTAVVERTSKVGSLKRNYGGVTPSRRRNTDGIAKLREDYLNQLEENQE